MRRTRTKRTSTNSPNVQSSTGTNPSPSTKAGQRPGKKTCPPGFKLVNGRCEFVYDKTKYKK